MISAMFHAQNRVKPEPPTPTYIFEVNDFETFSYLESSKTVTFVANPDDRVGYISKPSWVSSVFIDNVNNTITVTVIENTSVARFGNIVFHCNNGADDVTKKYHNLQCLLHLS